MTGKILASFLAFSFFLGLFTSYAVNDDTRPSNGGESQDTGASNSEVERAAHEVVVIQIDGTINPATVDYINDGIELTKNQGAEALIIELDTPGGLLTSTKDIVKLILNSPVPVVVYVYPSGASATSAGVFITLSGHIAAMAEGTSIGAAHPVTLGGDDRGRDKDKDSKQDEEEGKGEGEGGFRSQEEIMGEKIENYAISFIESIAEKRKRNTDWAIEAVRSSASITSSEALKKNVIDLISSSLSDLLERIEGFEVELPDGTKKLSTKGARIERVEMNIKQKMVDILSTPNIAFLLLSLGSLGLTVEIFKPGMIFPGVVGTICFITGCVSLQILPFNYAGLALLIIALALFVADLYVTSYGLLSIAGVVSFIMGGILLFERPEIDVRVGLDVVLSTGFTLGLFFVMVAYFLFRAQRLTPSTGIESLVGQRGQALTEFDGAGKIFVSGEYWDAEGEEAIHRGDRVEVVEVGPGMRLRVRKVGH